MRVTVLHDLLSHPRFGDLYSLLRLRNKESETKREFPVTGPSLTRHRNSPDWLQVLAERFGLMNLWFTFHGTREIHDYMVQREGAFEETVHFMRQANEQGFSVGAYVFLSNASLASIRQLLPFLQERVTDEQIAIDIPAYVPNKRLREFEKYRPTLEQIQPEIRQLVKYGTKSRVDWSHIKGFTEESWATSARNRRFERVDWRFWSITCTFGGTVHLGHPGDLGMALGQYESVSWPNLIQMWFNERPPKTSNTWIPFDRNPDRTKLHTSLASAAEKWADISARTASP